MRRPRRPRPALRFWIRDPIPRSAAEAVERHALSQISAAASIAATAARLLTTARASRRAPPSMLEEAELLADLSDDLDARATQATRDYRAHTS